MYYRSPLISCLEVLPVYKKSCLCGIMFMDKYLDLYMRLYGTCISGWLTLKFIITKLLKYCVLSTHECDQLGCSFYVIELFMIISKLGNLSAADVVFHLSCQAIKDLFLWLFLTIKLKYFGCVKNNPVSIAVLWHRSDRNLYIALNPLEFLFSNA